MTTALTGPADVRDQQWLDERIGAARDGIEAVIDIAVNWTGGRGVGRLHPGIAPADYVREHVGLVGRAAIVPLLLESNWSNRQIAAVAGVSPRTVGRIAAVPNGTPERPAESLGADGKLYPARRLAPEDRPAEEDPRHLEQIVEAGGVNVGASGARWIGNPTPAIGPVGAAATDRAPGEVRQMPQVVSPSRRRQDSESPSIDHTALMAMAPVDERAETAARWLSRLHEASRAVLRLRQYEEADLSPAAVVPVLSAHELESTEFLVGTLERFVADARLALAASKGLRVVGGTR